MAKEIKNEIEEEIFDEGEESVVVEMTDDEGNVYLYEEEMIIPIDDKKFALLVAIPNEEEHHHHGCGCKHHHEHEDNHECGCEHHHHYDHHCECGCENEDDVIIAKIIVNADGQEEYVEPTDEEFEIVRKAYEDFFSESVDDENGSD